MQASGRIGELRTTAVNHLRTLDVYIVKEQVGGVTQLGKYSWYEHLTGVSWDMASAR